MISFQAKGKGFTGSWAFPLDYEDSDQISGWANEAMHWMVMTGVMNGVSEMAGAHCKEIDEILYTEMA